MAGTTLASSRTIDPDVRFSHIRLRGHTHSRSANHFFTITIPARPSQLPYTLVLPVIYSQSIISTYPISRFSNHFEGLTTYTACLLRESTPRTEHQISPPPRTRFFSTGRNQLNRIWFVFSGAVTPTVGHKMIIAKNTNSL